MPRYATSEPTHCGQARNSGVGPGRMGRFSPSARSRHTPLGSPYEQPSLQYRQTCSSESPTFIIGITLLAVGFFGYACYLLMSALGDARRLDKARQAFKNVFIGTAIAISSYMLVAVVVNIYVGATRVDEVITFWDETVFCGGVSYGDLLSDDKELALTGEVLLITGGDNVVVCEAVLEPAATAAGWSYSSDIAPGSTTTIPGCERIAPY